MVTKDTIASWLRDQVAAAVSGQSAVRLAVSRAAAVAAHRALGSGRGLVRMVEAAAAGAAKAATQDAAAGSARREAVEGLADGFVVAAQALQWTVREAAAEARVFARSDLDRMAEDLGALAAMFVDAVERGARTGAGQTQEIADSMRLHAERALLRAWPALASAAATARRRPAELGIDLAVAGSRLVEEAAAGLRSRFGQRLQHLGVDIAGSGAGSP